MAKSQHESSHISHIVRDMEKEIEFVVGMVFSNELEAYHKYVAYAIGKWFGVRKGNMFRNRYSDSLDGKEKKYQRYEVRCGCLAHIKYKVDNGIYEVIEYVVEHNHPFIPEDQKHMIRRGRLISDTCKSVLVDMNKAGIGGTTSYKFLTNETRGNQNLDFNLRDCQNYLQTRRSEVISGGDCQNLLNHFHCI
ncbi:hypothetical protein ACJRO7_007732 [Eucalyptus globulus]|uniref:Protein FAR1-RELATED SEQUENCE n=1 Tax=Eucalyptus globulus TaxID=34317 RepID=A0ABD3IP15_EUCGL